MLTSTTVIDKDAYSGVYWEELFALGVQLLYIVPAVHAQPDGL